MSTTDEGPDTNATDGTAAPKTADELEADIARQREALAATVTDLQARLDVKARAKAKVADLKSRATTADGKPTPAVSIGAGSVLAVVITLVVLRIRRRNS